MISAVVMPGSLIARRLQMMAVRVFDGRTALVY